MKVRSKFGGHFLKKERKLVRKVEGEKRREKGCGKGGIKGMCELEIIGALDKV